MEVKNAVIMAGGEGLRMKPVSDYLPKFCLPIYDKPLIIKQIEWLHSSGVGRIILTVSKKFGSVISNVLSNCEYTNMIEIVEEEDAKGLGYSLLEIKNILNKEDFILLLGDEYFDCPKFFDGIKNFNSNDIILGAVEYSEADTIMQGCNLKIDEHKGEVTELIEKPERFQIVSNWCWSGVAVLNQDLMSELEKLYSNYQMKGNQIIIDSLNNLAKRGIPVKVIKEKCNNINLTTIEDYYRAFRLEYVVRNGGE